MPNRIIKESICCSDDIDQLGAFAETVFYRLIVNADDYGRIDARISFLSHKLFVTKKGITEKSIEEAVAQLASVKLIELYEVEGRPFLLFPKWHLHQRVRNSKEKYPPPPKLAANCGELPRGAESSGYNPIQSESNPNLEGEDTATTPAREDGYTSLTREEMERAAVSELIDVFAGAFTEPGASGIVKALVDEYSFTLVFDCIHEVAARPAAKRPQVPSAYIRKMCRNRSEIGESS